MVENPGQESLSALLRTWRQRLDPARIPGLVIPGRTRQRGVSQAEVARLIGVSERWYGELERGRQANFSAEILDRLSALLLLSSAERLALFLHATGAPPGPNPGPPPEAFVAADDAFQELLDAQQSNPAYVSDIAWNIVRLNRAQSEWFPWVCCEPNLMRWCFLYPEAREQLVNWRDGWARPLLGQLRVAVARHRDYEPLQQLLRDILAGNAEAREIWDAGDVYEHPDGDVRGLRLPYHQNQEIAVRIMAFVPMRSLALRFIVLIPVDGT
ncbi:helix-turn-helix transcriptional regulator [Streptomyces sp. NPDC002588]|uniref:helix-turn-helix transcriptional regulator n=1 Tax=Streptomyces sp. NPDC002588 TaxID=3154419 RepID=UPI00331CED70